MEGGVVGLNCKRGDIAMVKAPYAPAGRGAVVEVVRPARASEKLSGCLYVQRSEHGHGWVVRGWVKDDQGRLCGPRLVIADECLRPLRGSDGQDEMLRIAGRPQALETV
jgi:hypothetical protein